MANLSLLTDLYQITMAQGYYETGKQDNLACFYMFFRENPFAGGYSVACGIDQICDLVEGFSFSSSDIEYLASLEAPGGGKMFKSDFLDYLAALKLCVDIDAVEEGELVFPREPIVRVSGPIMQCQLLETALLNGVNFQTLIATKAARVCLMAQGPVAEFGLRRAQGPDGGVSASRAAYIGGCASTSNVLAGKRFDIPVSGTHAHSWVMAFEHEIDAFRSYAKMSPKNCVLLVDTYNVEEGVKNAIVVAREMEECGEHLAGIRIDSGDLAWMSRRARAMLDEAGFPQVKIVASNNLDEYTIASLKEQGACIDSWGVGTNLATAYDQAALGGVYKLSALWDEAAQAWEPKLKATEQAAKATIPGVLDVRRYVRDDGSIAGDMIFDISNPPLDEELIIDPLDRTRRKSLDKRAYTTLLAPLVRDGKVVREREPIATTRERALARVHSLDPSITRLLRPHEYPVGLEASLFELRDDILLQVKGFKEAAPNKKAQISKQQSKTEKNIAAIENHKVSDASAANILMDAPTSKSALLLVDIQNDFCPGGALAVEQGDEVVPAANELIAHFVAQGLPIIATCDYHPAGHVSFASSHAGAKVGDVITVGESSQYLWPDHCLQGTHGAELHPSLHTDSITYIVNKGTDKNADSYSAFFDNNRVHETALRAFLQENEIRELVVCGLATDYCVKYSVLDALSLGFAVTVVAAACRAVNVCLGDEKAAYDEMIAAGAIYCEKVNEA